MQTKLAVQAKDPGNWPYFLWNSTSKQKIIIDPSNKFTFSDCPNVHKDFTVFSALVVITDIHVMQPYDPKQANTDLLIYHRDAPDSGFTVCSVCASNTSVLVTLLDDFTLCPAQCESTGFWVRFSTGKLFP